MNNAVQHDIRRSVDSIQERLTTYACSLAYDGLSPEAIHGAKVRVIDTLGALIGGFFDEPCRIARNLAAPIADPRGATIIGTRMKTTPDMAAFANGTAARTLEMTDVYHGMGSFGGHASDTVAGVLAAAEHAQVRGREFITGVVLAYEVYLRISDVFSNDGWDHTNLARLGTAVAAGKLLGLTSTQLSHCISMVIVPNNVLRQARLGDSSMWKATATGDAGRAAVFAAILARAGMEGPHLPFEGKAGWCEHVALKRFALDTFGGNGTPFKIPETLIKIRPSAGGTIPSILAAEKIAPLKQIDEVKEVTVETFGTAALAAGTGEQRWNPASKESADHSIPYVTAATLIDGTLTPRSFNDAHLWNRELRALMQKLSVVENEEYTRAYNRQPREHRARVTVITRGGERLVGEAGGDDDDMGAPTRDAQIEAKFRALTEDVLGAQRVNTILDRLWHLEDLGDIAEVPADFVFD